jgi:NAD(P)-dependent dehydrogenase (short-subunit alcohol dehydrogenase family)
MLNLANQAALITGGTQGIGQGIALALARAGARVIVAGREPAKAHRLLEELAALGIEAAGVQLDVTNTESVERCIDEAIRRFSRIDILVNNAGVHCEKIGQPSTIEQFTRVFDVNLFGVWRMTQALIPHFRSQGGGKIINIASINGRKPWVDTPAYSASKAALISVTQSLAAKLGGSNINVNAVCPGGINTPMADLFKPDRPTLLDDIINQRVLKRELLPDDIGQAVLFLASPLARNITGQSLNVDGGVVMS